MAAAQQVSCLVAATCTDSDFAKQFKALVRKKLLALRHDFQHAQKNTSSVFKVGALEIVTSVAWAQQEMTAKNWQDQWVLRAAVRNGLLAWRPNPETGRLEEVCSQPWAKELGLSMGSRKIPPQWFQDRLKWLEPSRQTDPSVILLRPAQTCRDGTITILRRMLRMTLRKALRLRET